MVPEPRRGPKRGMDGARGVDPLGRSQAAESRLATLMLFEGKDLGQALATWSDRTGSAIIVVEGREVAINLMAAYAAEGVEAPDLLHLAH